jgi:predicted nucleic acid-binding protein
MIILDTNVVSEIMRPVPQQEVMKWFATQFSEDVHVTAVTMAEVLFGIQLLPAGQRRAALQAGADKTFAVFAGHILPFDDRAAHEFSILASTRQKRGRPISEFDAQMAAIARANHATLATRNTDDFQGCEVQLVNPWTA